MSATEPYDLQRLYAEKAGPPFEFTWADQVWTVPNMMMLDIEQQEHAENMQPDGATTETIFQFFDDVMGAEQGARWREVRPRPLPMIFDLLAAWLAHSKGELGESPASDDSSKSTGRPSNPTSNGSTGSASRKRSTPRAKRTATAPVS
jgi:hypothetical protein